MQIHPIQSLAILLAGFLLTTSSAGAQDAQELPPLELKEMVLTLPKSGFATPILGDEGQGDALTYNVTGQVFNPPRPIPFTRVTPSEITSPWQVVAAFLATGRAGDLEGGFQYYTEESLDEVRQIASDPSVRARWLAFMTGLTNANALAAIVHNSTPEHFELHLFVQTTGPGDYVFVTPMRVRKVGDTFKMHGGLVDAPMIQNIQTFLSTNDVSQLQQERPRGAK